MYGIKPQAVLEIKAHYKYYTLESVDPVRPNSRADQAEHYVG